MAYHFSNLVFEGGGVKGIAYVGALQVLQEKNILDRITRVGGTSAGAINATLLALGYRLDDVKKILSGLDFKSFLDDSWGVVRDTDRLIHSYGWYKGDCFRGWIGNLIAEKLGNEHATFLDLKNAHGLDLYLTGTNLSTQFAEVFSCEHSPRMCIADAARISMSMPLFFTAVRKFRGDLLIDGGCLDNYPVKLFDRAKYVSAGGVELNARRTEYYEKVNVSLAKTSSPYIYNKETLGFRLDSGREIAVFRDGAEPPREDINDFFDYVWALLRTVNNAQEDRHLHSDDWHRTIYIDTLGVKTTDFDLSDDKKQALFESGRSGTKQYFDWYDTQNPDNFPINHPESAPAQWV